MQALDALISKEAVQQQGELLCTRTFLPHEKVSTAKKSSTVQVPLGGLCFKKTETTVNSKVEKSTDELLLVLSGNQPKHCSHLLK